VDIVSRHPSNFSFLSDQKLKVVSQKKGTIATLREAEKVIDQLDDCIGKN